MIRKTLSLALLGLIAFTSMPQAAEPNENLLPLAPFVGKTWRGEFAESTPQTPMIDVQKWEWALNGQAVRILHSLNDGEYGGETLVIHDRERDRLLYFYFTTAGFYTTGTIAADDSLFVSHEEVSGNADGITAVRGTSRLRADGKIHMQSEYLKNGSWVPGLDVTYAEAPDAEVRFR